MKHDTKRYQNIECLPEISFPVQKHWNDKEMLGT